ncbi:FtsX-like permease family protein [Streptacidiphilus albus]|uniref:FtsX-like permease family protein n=1 Tax=Streptacidiphilus albus TaxID=105425 RepID=UPI0005A81941|nr:ABC transporter permease [Streptacidiphilus albus]
MTAPNPSDQVRFPRLAQYAIGLRLAFTGGRDARIRVTLTALAVGLGVAVLLLVSSVPSMDHAHDARIYSQEDSFYGSAKAPRTNATVLIEDANTVFKGAQVRGRIVQPEGSAAPLPPGVAHYPAPGQMVVSPALRDLLNASGSELLRQRLPYPVVGTIGQAGLLGPSQLSYILGSDQVTFAQGAVRIDHYGQYFQGQPLSPVLILLSLVGFVVMMAPVAVILATAARFGGEQRDRRLAALRLSGADRAMTVRTAAGESLAGSLLGLAVGAGFFLLARQLAQLVTVEGVSFFPQDIQPQPAIAALIAVVVPLLAVFATLAGLRRVVLDPLGVVRRAGGSRRRIWWRAPLPAIGLVVLYYALRQPDGIEQTKGMALTSIGMVLLLCGIAALLPWVVQGVTRVLPSGSLSQQLAVRRLQLGTGSASWAVSGIVVAVAGAIALQVLFSGVSTSFDVSQAQSDAFLAQGARGQAPAVGQYQATVEFPGRAADTAQDLQRLRTSPAVSAVIGYQNYWLTAPSDPNGDTSPLRIADCAVLEHFAVLPHCVDGDAFLATANSSIGLAEGVGAGQQVHSEYGDDSTPGPNFRLPAVLTAVQERSDPMSQMMGTALLLVTPGALPASVVNGQGTVFYVGLDQSRPDAADQLRTTVALTEPSASPDFPADPTTNHNFSVVTRGLVIGAMVTLLLIGLSLLVGQLEQLQERRRVLAVLSAFGTRRSTLALSVLWQTALPVVLGLLLASAGGLALGAVLLHLAQLPQAFAWGTVLATAGMGAVAVLLVTALSLPALLRITRPSGLRFE